MMMLSRVPHRLVSRVAGFYLRALIIEMSFLRLLFINNRRAAGIMRNFK